MEPSKPLPNTDSRAFCKYLHSDGWKIGAFTDDRKKKSFMPLILHFHFQVNTHIKLNFKI